MPSPFMPSPPIAVPNGGRAREWDSDYLLVNLPTLSPQQLNTPVKVNGQLYSSALVWAVSNLKNSVQVGGIPKFWSDKPVGVIVARPTLEQQISATLKIPGLNLNKTAPNGKHLLELAEVKEPFGIAKLLEDYMDAIASNTMPAQPVPAAPSSQELPRTNPMPSTRHSTVHLSPISPRSRQARSQSTQAYKNFVSQNTTNPGRDIMVSSNMTQLLKAIDSIEKIRSNFLDKSMFTKLKGEKATRPELISELVNIVKTIQQIALPADQAKLLLNKIQEIQKNPENKLTKGSRLNKLLDMVAHMAEFHLENNSLEIKPHEPSPHHPKNSM